MNSWKPHSEKGLLQPLYICIQQAMKNASMHLNGAKVDEGETEETGEGETEAVAEGGDTLESTGARTAET